VGTGDGKINASAFPSAVDKAFSQDGKLYAVPANLATLVLYYNKDMFTAAGIADAPKTLADFQADTVKLTIGGDKPTQYGISLADHQTIQMWPILQWMNGGDIVDTNGCAQINKPASVDALKTWTDLVINKHISPVGQTGADADTLFSAKKAAMEINGPWAAAGFQQAGVNLGIAQVPVGPGGPVTLASSVPMLVAKSGKHQAQALEFLAWWTGKTAQTTFAQASGFPPVRTDMTDAVAGNQTVAQFAQALPNAKLYLPGLTQFAQIDNDIYVPFVGKITRGSDVQKEADSAASAINALTGCKS
jgi:multiple sugar transport system substrate-binding protein